MPLFYFDINDGEFESSDEDGVELPDLQAMRTEAIRVLPDLARNRVPHDNLRTYVSKVRDESGRVVFSATMTLVATWFIPPPK